MKAGISPLLLMACTWWLAAASHASAQAARVAVAGDSSLANLVDVTTGELSKEPELSVLDRADLDKLGQEQELQSVLDAKDFSPVRLLPADGLVLLRAVTQDGKTGVFARLVAVQPGVILREVALPDSADPSTQAQALAKEFAPYWTKLAAIQKGKITALSLLGLRFEVDAPETRDLERSINILLASRLGTEPDTLVLERWRLNDAVFEKSLAPQPPAPFWTGSSLIDGSMRWEKETNRIDVTLRVRPPQGATISITESDTADHLPALAGRLADKIQNRPMAPEAWQPTAEAAHYSELGKWCLDNRLFEEGAEALESALALGDNSRTTHMLQVKAYAMLAYPDDLRVVNVEYNKVDAKITPESLPTRVAAAARAASLCGEYLKANRDFSSQMWNLEAPFDLSVPVLNSCVRTLRAAYENGYQRDHGDEMAETRHEIQKLVAAMEEYVREKHPSEDNFFHDCLIRYAGLWHETPEETLAFYRELLNRRTGEGGEIRGELFRGGLVPPYLDGEGEPAETAPWSLQSPWIVAWDGRSEDDLKTIWRNFLKELAASPDPVLQADALKFEYASNRTNAGREEVVTRTVTFLKQHPENIYGPNGENFTAGFSVSLSLAKVNPACWNDLLDLYTKLYQQHVPLPPSWIFATAVLMDERMPAETAKSLLLALTDYTHWYQSQTPQNDQVVEALARARQTIYNCQPELVPAVTAPAADAISVPLAWDNQNKVDAINGPKQSRPLAINFRTLACAENKFWDLSGNEVFCLDPSNWQIVSSDSIPAQFEPPRHSPLELRARYIAVTPQWLVVAYAGQVLLCSRTDHQWHALNLPPSTYKPCWVDGELYLIYEAEHGAVLQRLYSNGAASIGSGLIRVSLPDEKIENLVSSRRIPPQNALDGTLLGQPDNLWMSQAGLTLAIDGGRPYFQVYASPVGKDDWTSVATDRMPCLVRTTEDGAVIGHGFSQLTFDEISRMNGKGNEVLLANPDKAGVNGLVKPLWKFPDELRSSPPGIRSEIAFVMRGDDLCLSHSTLGDAGVADQAAAATLYYFSRGQKEGIEIPLAFDVTQVKGPGLVAMGGLEATANGLIFSGGNGSWSGFWALSWSDIDAYRAKAQPTAAASP